LSHLPLQKDSLFFPSPPSFKLSLDSRGGLNTINFSLLSFDAFPRLLFWLSMHSRSLFFIFVCQFFCAFHRFRASHSNRGRHRSRAQTFNIRCPFVLLAPTLADVFSVVDLLFYLWEITVFFMTRRYGLGFTFQPGFFAVYGAFLFSPCLLCWCQRFLTQWCGKRLYPLSLVISFLTQVHDFLFRNKVQAASPFPPNFFRRPVSIPCPPPQGECGSNVENSLLISTPYFVEPFLFFLISCILTGHLHRTLLPPSILFSGSALFVFFPTVQRLRDTPF